MPALRELQADFAAALMCAGQGSHANIRTDGLPVAARIAIYQNNTLSNYLGALAAVYPVVQALTGDAWFRQHAARYIAQTPSSSGDIQLYGETFPDYLAQLDALPYLADVALLEWHVHCVFHAAEATPLQPAALAGLSPSEQTRLCFQLHPACRLIHSAYPVQRIWAVNQPDYAGDAQVQLADGGTPLLVQRQGTEIHLVSLSAPAYQLLQWSQQGLNLGEILDAMRPEDFNQALLECFNQQAFSNYFLQKGIHHE